MKILQIATQVPVPTTDGGKKSVYGVTNSLFNLGHEIDFVCYRKSDNYEMSFKELSKICNPHILNIQTNNSIWGAFWNMFSVLPYNVSKYKTKVLEDYLIKLLAKKEFDIIQLEHSHLGWLAKKLKKETKTPIILRAQNLELKILERFVQNAKNPFIKTFAKLQYKKALNYEPKVHGEFTHSIMISEKDQTELLKLNSRIHSSVIPAGIDLDLLELKKSKIIPYTIVHIGHTDWFPNHDGLAWFLNEVFPSIILKFPETKLFVYGGGKTKDFPVPKEFKKNVVLVGYAENLWQELQNKAIAIVPLRIGGGIRIKILEFLATGQIIVSTSIGKEGINLLDKKHILVADSKEEFIEKICDCFENRIDIGEMQENGRKFIKENYIWPIIGKKFQELYYSLI